MHRARQTRIIRFVGGTLDGGFNFRPADSDPEPEILVGAERYQLKDKPGTYYFCEPPVAGQASEAK
jgi:hypothetical protein